VPGYSSQASTFTWRTILASRNSIVSAPRTRIPSGYSQASVRYRNVGNVGVPRPFAWLWDVGGVGGRPLDTPERLAREAREEAEAGWQAGYQE
jgi:hypothetical protein